MFPIGDNLADGASELTSCSPVAAKTEANLILMLKDLCPNRPCVIS